MSEDFTTAQRFLLMAHPGKTLREVLSEVLGRHTTMRDAAAELEVAPITLRCWLKDAGLDATALRVAEGVAA